MSMFFINAKGVLLSRFLKKRFELSREKFGFLKHYRLTRLSRNPIIVYICINTLIIGALKL